MSVSPGARSAAALLLVVATLGAAWEAMARVSSTWRFFLASPGAILNVTWHDLWHSGLWLDTLVTGAEAGLGLVIGFVVGAIFGLALGLSDRLAGVVRPVLLVLGSLPLFAIAPITVLWFGTGFEAKVWLAGLSTVFLAAGLAYQGARGADPELAEVLQVFHASRWQTFTSLLLPGAVAWLIAGVRHGVGLAIIGAFLGEFISSQRGLGHYILKASSLYDSPRVFSGLVMLLLVALSLSGIGAIFNLAFWRRARSTHGHTGTGSAVSLP